MIQRQQYSSVSEMVRKTTEDAGFADDFDRRLGSRQLVKTLATLRTIAGLTQEQLAEKLGCTQSKVSRLAGRLRSPVWVESRVWFLAVGPGRAESACQARDMPFSSPRLGPCRSACSGSGAFEEQRARCA